MDNSQVGAQIAILRKERGISQSTLAEYLNISSQAVSKWERGTSCPDISQLPVLSEYFGVSIDRLFGSPEQRKPRYEVPIGCLPKAECAKDINVDGYSQHSKLNVADTTPFIPLNKNWKILQDVHDYGERLGIFRPDYNTNEIGPQMSNWEDLPSLQHLQLVYAAKPYYGRELRQFNNAPWWYLNEFIVPEALQTHYVLHFSNVDYFCKVYLNGELLGEHEGYGAPFSFELDDAIRRGGINRLVVKVWSPWDTQISCDDKRSRTYRVTRGLFKGTYEHSDGLIQRDVNPVGIYGNVWVDIITDAHIEKQPDVLYTLHENNKDADIRVKISLKYLKNEEHAIDVFLVDRQTKLVCAERQTAVSKDGDYYFDLFAADIRLWSTWDHGEQWLYDIVVQIKNSDGMILQKRSQILGFVRQELHRDAETTIFYQNGRRFYVRGTSYFPDVYVSAMSRERYMRDLILLKQLGFNMVRVHVHTEQAEFYELCSELGMAVFQDSDFNWHHNLDEAHCRSLIRQFLDVVDYLKPYPAMMVWSCLNEPGLAEGGSPEQSIAMAYAPGPELFRLVGEHDPNRPRIKGSFCTNDLTSGDSHNYTGSLSGGQLMDINNQTEKLNTEYGFDAPGCIANLRTIGDIWEKFKENPAHISDIQEYQYMLMKYYTEHYRMQKYQPNGGYIQFMFIDLCPQSFYGMIDWWGMPKRSADAMLESNQPVGIFMKYSDQMLEAVYAVNDTEKELKSCEADCIIVTADGKPLHQLHADIDLAADGVARAFTLDMNEPEIAYVSLVLKHDGHVIANNTYVHPLTPILKIKGHPERFDHELGMRIYDF